MMRTFLFSLTICLVLCYITLNHVLQLASFTALDFQQDLWIILRHRHIFLSGFSGWRCKIPYLRWLILIIWFHRSNSLFMQEPLANNSGYLAYSMEMLVHSVYCDSQQLTIFKQVSKVPQL